MLSDTSRAWVELSADALRHNFALARSLVGDRKIMPVIKGNAHGHGALFCARVLAQEGADAFAVACIDEAIALREGGISRPILILGYTEPQAAPELLQYKLTQSVFSEEYGEALSRSAVSSGGNIPVHIKLDTGMTRTGIFAQGCPEAAADAILRLDALPGLAVTGLFTHYAAADMPEKDDFTAMQLENYRAVLEALRQKGFTRPIVRHTGNSASILNHPETYFDMVRAGVMLYGFSPDGVPREGPLEPVLCLKARVIQVKDIPAGACVSYGCTFTAPKPMMLAVVSAGYADSYPRSLSGKGAWGVIRGQKCPQVGRICMDLCMFDVTGLQVRAGDEIILYGRGGMSLDEAAHRAGTINCEITSLLTNRVKRTESRGRESRGRIS